MKIVANVVAIAIIIVTVVSILPASFAIWTIGATIAIGAMTRA